MSVLRTMAGTMVAKGLGLLSTLLVGIVLFRVLGPRGKGEVDALVLWATLLLLVCPSVEEPQLYLLGKRRREVSRFVGCGVLLSLLFAALCWLALDAVERWFPSWLSFRDRASGKQVPMDLEKLRLLVAVSPFPLMQRILGGVLQGLRAMRAFNACFLWQNATLLVLVVTMVWGGGGGQEAAIWAHVWSLIAGGVVALFLALAHPEVRGRSLLPSGSLMKELVVGGVRLHGGVIAAWLILFSDQLMLNRFQGPSQVALYAIAVAYTGHLRRLVVQPVKDVLGSRLPAMVDDPRRVADVLAQTCRHVILLTVVPGLALVVGGWLLLLVLYGETALPAYWPLIILVPGSVFWGGAVILGYWFIGTDRYLTLTVVGLGIASLNVALNLLVIPTLGMEGAAATSTICYGVHLLVFILVIRIQAGTPASRFLWPKRDDLLVYRDAWRGVRARLPGRRT